MGRIPRRGIAYVLAMLYLLLFTVLAVGFYAGSTISVQVARNDRSAADAQAAAESGMQFVRYQLGRLSIPAETSDANLLPAVSQCLAKSLNDSPSMDGRAVDVSAKIFYLPAQTGWIALDPATGTKFQAQLVARGSSLWVKVIGCGNNESIVRAIQMEFRRTPRLNEADRLTCIPGSYEEVGN